MEKPWQRFLSYKREREKHRYLSIYVAHRLLLQTDSASLLQTMHQRGLSVSYDRLGTFSTDFTNSK